MVCSIEGCVIGGVGKTQEEAVGNFVASINRREALYQMSVQGCMIVENRAPLPGHVPNQPTPGREPLILPAGVTPEQFQRIKENAKV